MLCTDEPSPGQVIDGQTLYKPAGVMPRAMRTFGLYAAVLITDGGGLYADARGVRQAVTRGHLILVFPELPHRYGPSRASDWHEFYLTFDGPVFDLWREAGLLSADRPIWSLSPVARWARSMRHIRVPGEPDYVAVGRLQAWLAEAAAAQPDRPGYPRDKDPWVTDARRILESNLEQALDMGQIAQDLGVSYDHFRKRFTRAVGVAPARHRASRVIEQAATLMRTTAMSDKQIADALGFCDAFYFSRRFKQITGRSPSAYRKAMGA